MLKIVTDIKKLTQPCKKVSLEEGLEIGELLLKNLDLSDDGIGLAANQVGIDAAVCVIKVKEEIVLVNPEILGTDGEHIGYEGCLSFPGKNILTKRGKWVTVKTDNIGTVVFGPSRQPWDDPDQILESVCVQHEISHLEGKTMFDFEYKRPPAQSERKYGRNEKITITNGIHTKVLKYKKAQALLETEEWIIK